MWERKILISIHGPVAEQGIWRIRTNQKMRGLYNDLDKIADIKKERLEWIRHVVKMDQGRTVKKVF